VSAKTT
jgi:ammonium transporter, Amt family